MHPRRAKDVSQVRLATMQLEEKWKAIMSELGVDVKIPDVWRMSALLEICPKNVKEHMMRQDEIPRELRELQGESGVMHDPQDRASARRTDRDACAHGGGPRECQRTRRGRFEDVDEVRRRSICYNCRMMELFAKDCTWKGKGKGRGADGSKAYAKGKGKTMNGAGKTGADISGGHKGGPWGDVGKLGIPRTELDVRSNRAHVSSVPTAAQVEDSLSQRRIEKSEECRC